MSELRKGLVLSHVWNRSATRQNKHRVLWKQLRGRWAPDLVPGNNGETYQAEKVARAKTVELQTL